MTFIPGEKFTTEAEGFLMTFTVKYRAKLLPWRKGPGYAHVHDETGNVFIIERVSYDPAVPFNAPAGRKIGMHGGEWYVKA